jgi:hypothetical protein
MHRLKILSTLAVIFCFAGAMPPEEQEHPQEHPKQGSSATKPVSTATFEKAIKDQIAEKAKPTSGKLAVRDDVLNKTSQLELVKVHTDKLTHSMTRPISPVWTSGG